jgi:glycosyltransferase 2 family protein
VNRTAAGFVLRLAVTVAFGALALWGTGAGAVLNELAGGKPSWILGALAVLPVSYALAAVRWWLLLRGQQVAIGLRTALSLTWIGLFAGNLLPTGFGGDAVRAWMGGRRTGALALVTASVLIDRLTAVWALFALGVVGVVVGGSAIPEGAAVSLVISSAAVVIGSVVLLASAPARLVVLGTRRWPGISGRVERLGQGLGRFGADRRLLVAAVLTSVACQSCVIVAAWMLARGLGLHLGLGVVAVAVPVALLSTAVPTSINGLGVHQAVFRALLVPAGLAPAEAVAFSVSTIAAGALVSLPGIVFWVRRRNRGPDALSAAAAPRPSLPQRTPSAPA